MKTTLSKPLIGGVISLVIASATIVPAYAVSENANTNSSANRQTVCNRIDTFANVTQNNLSAHIRSMKADFAARLARVDSNVTSIDQKITADRQTAMNQFEEKVQTMLDQSGLTENQIQAINTYYDAMLAAENTRSLSVDSARATYRTSLRQITNDNQQMLTNAADSYQRSVNTAIATAKATCDSQDNSISELRSSIANARKEMLAVKNTEQVRSQIDTKTNARNADIQAANQAFSDTAATLTAALEDALAQSVATD